MNQAFVKVVVDVNPDKFTNYDNIPEWRRHQEFNAVNLEIEGNEFKFAAGGHRYSFSTEYYTVSLMPFIA